MPEVQFLEDGGMDFATRCVLSGVAYGMAEVGEVLATVSTVHDGDPDSWRTQWLATAHRVQVVADQAAAGGHRASAHGAYLRAANYLFAGNWYAPLTRDADDAVAAWGRHRDCWDAAVAHWPTPAEPVAVPDGSGGTLPGYWFSGSTPPEKAGPLVMMVNGIETPMSDTTMTGLVDGLARGYRVLCLDGPGQGAALYRDGRALTTRWTPVLGAALEWAAGRPGVDPARMVLMGVNHGGLFSTQAAGGGVPVAALVLDPGVHDVAGDVVGALPAPLQERWQEVGSAMDITVDEVAGDPDLVLWRAKNLDPFPGSRVGEALAALEALSLDDAALASVRCPTYLADPEDAESFKGQGAHLASVLAGAGTEVHHDRFTRAEGAGLDCEILAPQVRNQRVYDWLDRTLATPGP